MNELPKMYTREDQNAEDARNAQIVAFYTDLAEQYLDALTGQHGDVTTDPFAEIAEEEA